MKILVLNGPNLNLLGVREPDVYGNITLEDINNELVNMAGNLGIEVECFQTNSETKIIDKIQSVLNNFDGIIINAAAYTHTSIAIRDAIAAVKIPTIEVHLSNIHAREEFRQKSVIAPICIGQICGFKEDSYKLALGAIVNYLKKNV